MSRNYGRIRNAATGAFYVFLKYAKVYEARRRPRDGSP